MLQIELTAEQRDNYGKGASRELRRNGQTPAVLYGPKMESPISLKLDTKNFTKGLLSINRKNAIINLNISTNSGIDTRHVITREIQTHPVDESLVHVDFYEVAMFH